MINIRKYFLKIFIFNDSKLMEDFNKWRESSRLIQMRVAAFITSFLYLVFAILSFYIVEHNALFIMTVIHLYIMFPLLFSIGILSYFKKFQGKIGFLLSFASVLAAIGNLYIIMKLDNNIIYLSETYLQLFWIFTMSGLRILYAVVAAFLVFVISFVGILLFVPMPNEIFYVHIFWMCAATLFGYFTLFFMNRSNKIIFINKKKLEKLAVTDELTGLFTRKKLDEVLKHELLRSKRFERKFCLMILDIDYFKDVNDTFGHQAGDYVLVEIVNLINLNKRATDVAIRWGGEEFVIIFLETDIDKAMVLAEKLRQIIEEHVFELIGNKTVSIGITQNRKNDIPASITKRADDALYSAKNSGRNRVEVI